MKANIRFKITGLHRQYADVVVQWTTQDGKQVIKEFTNQMIKQGDSILIGPIEFEPAKPESEWPYK